MSNVKSTSLKQFPTFTSDEEAERFVEEADLSDYDFSGFKPMRFELEKKTRQINLRVPDALLVALKAHAKQRQLPYQRIIREAIEQAITRK
jgi:predicted DNA binding CopG/RHH family protein